jgi:hypothetical protein
MSLRVPAALAGVLGGACWLVRGFADSEALRWAGLVLLALALAGAGAGLVKALWLRVIVAIAFPVLVWSVLEVVHEGASDAATVDAVAGAAVALISVAVLVRARSRRRAILRHRERRTSGSHAR